jgi:hypothetical protein
MRVETVTAIVMAGIGPIRQQTLRLVHRDMHLRWTNRKLTTLVHRFASYRAENLLPPPNLCADWMGWAASGYSVLTSGTQRFLHAIPLIRAGYGQLEGASVSEMISPLLARYEDHEDRKIASAIRRLTREDARRGQALGRAAESVLVTLGLQKPAP